MNALKLSLVAIVAALTSQPADAQKWTVIDTEWVAGSDEGKCFIRGRNERSDAANLHFLSNAQGSTASLIVTNPQISADDPGLLVLTLELGDSTFENIRVWPSSEPPVLAMIVSQALLDAFARTERLTVKNDGAAIAEIDLSGWESAFSTFADCREVAAENAAARNKQIRGDDEKDGSKPATLRISPSRWITPGDYRSHWPREWEGDVGVKLVIGTNGRVIGCNVTDSSGYADLDEWTCRLIKRRARFQSAWDAKGERVEGEWEGSITWQYPQ